MLETIQVSHFGGGFGAAESSSLAINNRSSGNREQLRVILNLGRSYSRSKLTITIKQQQHRLRPPPSTSPVLTCPSNNNQDQVDRAAVETQPKRELSREAELAERLAGQIKPSNSACKEDKLRQVGATLRDISDRFGRLRSAEECCKCSTQTTNSGGSPGRCQWIRWPSAGELAEQLLNWILACLLENNRQQREQVIHLSQ